MKLSRLVPATAFLFILLIANLYGLPEFTAKSEQKCNLCHVSPTGGGMRNSFGSQFFALNEMAAHQTSFEDVSKFQTQVSDLISIGADMRTLYTYNENTDRSSFFQMSGNFYLHAQLDQRNSLSLSKGLYDEFEIFGTSYVLPFSGYFRFGKFQPAYGWRFADHTSFVREKTLWPANSTDTGLEFGIYPHGLSANIGFFNGTGGMFDEDKGKAVSSRLEYRHNLAGIGFGIGGSYWLNSLEAGNIRMFGPFGYLNFLQGRLIYLGEIDWLEDNSQNPRSTGEATSLKLSYMLYRGIWLNATYDFYDPDIDFKTGKINRYGIGAVVFPYGFFEIQPNLWYHYDDSSNENKYIFFNTQLHFFF